MLLESTETFLPSVVSCGYPVLLSVGQTRCMGRYVLGFEEIDQTQVALVGGKGAHLGELARIEGIRVPPGFCVTTDAFRRIVAESAVDRRSARSAVAR